MPWRGSGPPMTIYSLKPRFQALLRPVTALLYRCRVSANAVTLAALFASLAYGAWLALAPSPRWPFLLLPALLLLRMALNAIDGMLAREYRQQSRLGMLLNEIGDVVSDAALYLPFALLPGVNPALVTAVVLLAMLTEFVGVLAQAAGAGRRHDGPFGKSDRAFAFGLAGLLIGAGLPLLPYLDLALAAMLALLGLTLFKRMCGALDVTA